MPAKTKIDKYHRWERLVYLEEAEYKKVSGKSVRMVKCLCECGNTVDVQLAALQKGSTKSCGCLQKETQLKITHGLSQHRLYDVWTGMKARCNNEKHSHYHNYGGRGIYVCEEWNQPNSFPTFLKDMGDPGKGFEIDREDNDGPYCKANCRWVSQKVNCQNRRGCYDWYYKGVSYPSGKSVAEVCGKSISQVYRDALILGSDIKKVIRQNTTPISEQIESNMPAKPRFHSNPEKIIEDAIRHFLGLRGWLVDKTHSTAYSSGWPDLMCWHPHFGLRWVDVKNPKAYTYTKAQCQTWPKWEKMGLGVWIMMAADDEEYEVLFRPPNFRQFWKPRYDEYLLEIEEILESENWDDEDE